MTTSHIASSENPTSIVVCSLSRLDETLEATGATRLVSLLSPGAVMDRPDAIAPDRHLDLRIHDITEAGEGYVLGDTDHVTRLIGFFREWDRDAPLLVHCYAGVSRSTAAAFIGLCTLAPYVSEQEHAAILREASPTATPNRRLVALADDLLKRGGRMNGAIDEIGRGADAYEGAPFRLAVPAPVQ